MWPRPPLAPQPVGSQLGIVPHVGEQLAGRSGPAGRSCRRPRGRSDRRRGIAEHAAQEVLLIERGEHQRRRDRGRVVEQVHLARARGHRWPRAARCRPRRPASGRRRSASRWSSGASGILVHRGHQESWKAGLLNIVTPPSTNTNSSRAARDRLGREIGRCGGASADELPEREIELQAAGPGRCTWRNGLLEIGHGESSSRCA